MMTCIRSGLTLAFFFQFHQQLHPNLFTIVPAGFRFHQIPKGGKVTWGNICYISMFVPKLSLIKPGQTYFCL